MAMGSNKGSLMGELVSFQAADGITLNGILCRVPRSKIGVIHLHGLSGNFYKNAFMKVLAKRFTKSGISFFSIEQRGSHTLSKLGRKRGRKYESLVSGGAVEKFENCTHDISGAIRFLKKQGITKIYLQGHSTGCQKAVYYLSREHAGSVKGLILIAPGDDYNIWRRDLGSRFPSVINYAKSIARKNPTMLLNQKYKHIDYGAVRFLSFCDPKNVESRIFNYDRKKLSYLAKIKIPILAVFGTKEQNAIKPVKTYLQILKNNAESSKFSGILIKGGNHAFFGVETQLANSVTKWVKQTLKT